MENLIYVLLGIAWVAYSLYSARQKAIQKQQSAGLPPREPSQSSPLPIPGGSGKSIFDEILRELSGEPKPVPQPVPQPVVQPVVPVKQTKPKNVSEMNRSYDDHSGYKFITSPSFDSSHTDLGNKWNTQEHSEDSVNEKPLSNKFDLRQAVIYSELLNRKYF